MKRRIFIPGPVELENEILLSMAKQIIGHRTQEFSEEVLFYCIEKMKKIYSTSNDVVIITASGTAAMDAGVASVIKEGEELIAIKGGKFGERFIEIARAYGAEVIEIDVAYGDTFDIEKIENAIKNSNAKAITLTHNETSTGVVHDASKIGKLAREYGLIFIMDAITSLGGDYVFVDKWSVDLCIAGSQKCLGAPPGLSCVSISEKAKQVINENSPRAYYVNLALYEKALKGRTTPFTPSVSLLFAFKKALEIIEKEGIENRIKRHRKIARACREAAKAINLELFAKEGCASNTVTAIRIPQNLNDEHIRGALKKEFNITLAGGQGELKNKIFRIGHMGSFDYFDLLGLISAIEVVLKKANHSFELGNGVKKAQEELLKGE